MKDRSALLIYAVVVVAVTAFHNLIFLSATLGLVVLLDGRACLRTAKKVALAVLLFNSIVTISYAVLSILQGSFSHRYVVLINLRVFLLTFLTFFLVRRINIFNALAFSRTLMYLVTLAYSHAMLYLRMFQEFRLARQSRTLERPSGADLYRHGAATGSFFLMKALADATVITEAMKSRGFFHD
jgi:cobalt/nickel transport system permease protein